MPFARKNSSFLLTSAFTSDLLMFNPSFSLSSGEVLAIVSAAFFLVLSTLCSLTVGSRGIVNFLTGTRVRFLGELEKKARSLAIYFTNPLLAPGIQALEMA